MHPDESAAAPPPADASSATTTPAPPGPALPEAGVAAAAEAKTEPGLAPAECGARLAELFPALFVAPGAPGPFKPIKLRIHADILARAPGVFSKRALGLFFSRYTTGNAYLKALAAPGAQRFDLDGQPAGEIAEEHRAAAAEELARRHAIAAERRAAQRRTLAPRPAPPAEGAALPALQPRPPPHERGEARRDRPEISPARALHEPRREPRRGPQPESRRDPRVGREPRAPAPQPDASVPPRRDAARHDGTAPACALPVDPAQRERALLLRAFESSPLSKANFCVLKRIGEAELDALLAQARAERR